MLKIIIGRAKSGKTAAAMAEIAALAAAGERGMVLLAPEQYSHEAERELLRAVGERMSLHAEVLSFSRLAQRVEAQSGRRVQRLDKCGRRLCMALALDAAGPRLRVYGSARRSPELQSELLGAIDELKSACIGPEVLAETAERCGGGLSGKMRDLALIYEGYSAVAAQGHADPTDALTELAAALPASPLARSRFWLDGFTDFTRQEWDVIAAILRCGGEATVCLTCDALTEGHEIFEPSRRAAGELVRIAQSLGVEYTIEKTQKNYTDSPIDAVERGLFAFGAVRAESGGAVVLKSAQSVTAECEGAAARCLELARAGCRWRDIAVAVRGFEDYRAALEAVFERYGVPLYTARKSSLSAEPLPALIRAAFDIVTGGWDADDVLGYIKSGLTGLSADESDELCGYALLWQLRGSAWYREADWTQHPAGFAEKFDDAASARLERINALRRRVVQPLKILQEGGRGGTAREQAKALADYFAALELPQIMSARVETLRSAGMEQEAAASAQLWDITVEALEQCAAVLGGMEMEQETFGRLFCLCLDGYDVGTIPLTLDRVSAGDMDRMRRRHIKHLIVLGCGSARIPMPSPSAGIFTDSDRETLAGLGLPIGESAPDRLYREFSLLYNCLTLPSETLYMSRCTADEGGAAAQPAFVVTRAAEIFSLSETPIDLRRCRMLAAEPAFELACAGDAGAAEYFRANDRGAELERIQTAAAMGRGRLSGEAVKSLYGDRLRLSASRAEKLASCRFAYFLQYGLKAKPRRSAAFSPPEMGTFMHYVLQGVASDIQSEGGFAGVRRERTDELCDKYVANYIEETLNNFRDKSPRFVYLFKRLSATVRAVVADMAEELRGSDFVPLDFELDFSAAGDIPPIELGEWLTLTGIADRVDGWLHGGKLYLRVVDYKTGRKDFSLSDVWYGLGLQMLLYLFALERSGSARYGAEIVPAGVLYVPARDALISSPTELTDEQIIEEKAKKRRRSGLVLDDEDVLNAMEHGAAPKFIPVKFKDGAHVGSALASAERFGQLSRHISGLLCSLAREPRAGSIEADPSFRAPTDSASEFCAYRRACRFDGETDMPRILHKMKPDEVWGLLENENGEGKK
ncbi:MAG: PD-(D/E)XK nuclease family protein [Oscillospiraceae bacterium]|nr:PD-(D/E)XK nuclease family protein [Oscillospiraceae bacterium]